MNRQDKNIDCLVIGDAMVDIILPLPDIPDGITLEELFSGGEITTQSRVLPGGVTNVAAGLAGLGSRTAFIGRIGDDAFGETIRKDLEDRGVITKLAVSSGKCTGMVYDLVRPDGERLFIVDRGANTDLSQEDIDPELIAASKVLYFSGYTFQDSTAFQAVGKAVRAAVSNHSLIIFNPGDPALTDRFRKQFLEIISDYSDILILNEAEALSLSGNMEEAETLAFLLNQGLKKVVLTKGKNGSVIATAGEVIRINPEPVEVMDTTGAGDAYAAAFIHGLVKGWEDGKSGEFASRVAAEVVSRFGSR